MSDKDTPVGMINDLIEELEHAVTIIEDAGYNWCDEFIEQLEGQSGRVQAIIDLSDKLRD